ncbi:MAG: WD40 repeat domain-containing protein [Planctomycetaceae bacterium]
MPRELYGIVVNSAGTIAAAAGADGSIHLLHGLDGSPSISTVAAHDEVNDVCFSPAGTLLASAGEDGLLRWWRVTETGLVAAGEARPGAGPLYAVAFAPDGRAIAAGGADCVVRLMNLAASEDPVELFRFEPPADTSPDIESIVFVNAGVLAASCGNRVVLLDATTGQLVRECDRPVIKASQAVFGGLTVSPDGARIMACGTDKRAHAWDVATGRIAVSLPTHPGWVQGCAFSADGMRVATACRDGGIRLFDATTGALLDRLVGHRGRVWSVAFEPSDALLSAGADGTVRRWDARGVTEAGLFRQIPSAAPEIITVFEAAWPLAGDPRGAIVACDCRRIPWAFDTSRNEAHVMTLPDVAPLWSLAADGRTGRLAVTRAVASPVMVFEPGASGAAAVPVALPDGIDSADALACWTPAGDLVIRSRDGGLFWCPSDLRPVRRVGSTSGTVHGVAAAPAWPPRVATWGDRAAVHQLPRSAADHADIPAPLVLPVADETTAVAWSPDAALVAVGTRTGAVHVFDAATGALRGTLAPHEHAIEALAFAGDGRTLVAADTDCVRVSDVATLSTFDHVRPGWNVRTLVLSADGDRLVIGGVAGETPDPGTARVGVMEFPKP